jgi:O-methyltransferase
MGKWTHNPKLQKLFGGGLFERGFLGLIGRLQIFLMGLHKDRQDVQLVRQTRRERRSLQTAYEAYTVYSFAKSYSHLPGALAEVGVFQGASAKLICEAKGDRELHLFDTFAGLPSSSDSDRGVHRENQYHCSLESVQKYLNGYRAVHFYPGLFPDSAQNLPERKFSFVHLDVDLYQSTLSCLEYFYPRLLPGGVILSHDYSLLAGVKKAFADFLQDKAEKPVELPSTQCLLIKLPAA